MQLLRYFSVDCCYVTTVDSRHQEPILAGHISPNTTPDALLYARGLRTPDRIGVVN